MAKARESTRIGIAILLALAATAAAVVASLVMSHCPVDIALMMLFSPVIFLVAVMAFGWLLVGPHRPPGPAPARPHAGAKPIPSRSVTRP